MKFKDDIIDHETERVESGLNGNEWDVAKFKIRHVTDGYFSSIQSGSRRDVRNQIVFAGVALLLGIASVLFLCNCFINLYPTGDLFQDLQKLFTN